MELADDVVDQARVLLHDLRNNLALVVNYSTLLMKELEGRPELTDDLTEVLKAGRRSGELAGELAAIFYGNR